MAGLKTRTIPKKKNGKSDLEPIWISAHVRLNHESLTGPSRHSRLCDRTVCLEANSMKRLVQWRKLLKEGDKRKMERIAACYSACAVGEKLGLGPSIFDEGSLSYAQPLVWEAKNATEEIGLSELGQQFYRYIRDGQLDKALETLREIEKA